MTISATVEKLYKQAINKAHPDKVADELKLEATDLTQQLNKARDKGDEATIKRIHADIMNGRVLKPVVDYRAELSILHEQGRDKKAAAGWVAFNGWSNDICKPIIDELWGTHRAGSTAKADVVSVIIAELAKGTKKADIVKVLMTTFTWSESTGKTVVAHIDYMIEYAKQAK